MDFDSLYTDQLDREDLEGELKNVVKWSYVKSDECPGKFLIVTCRWSAKIGKYVKNCISWKTSNVSPMFTAGDNNEFK